MARAITLSDTKDYILLADRELPADQRTVFEIGPLSARVRKQCTTLFSKDDNGQGLETVVRHGVKGWKNLRDLEGNEVTPQCDKGLLVEKSLDAISPYFMELATAIMRFSELSEADLGNSGTPPSGPPAG